MIFKTRFLIGVLALGLVTSLAEAKPKKKFKKPYPHIIKMEVKHGDKTTLINLKKNKKNTEITYKNNEGLNAKKRAAKDQFKRSLKTLKKTKSVSTKKCSRSYIKAKTLDKKSKVIKEWTSCLGNRNIASVNLTSIVNEAAILLRASRAKQRAAQIIKKRKPKKK